MVDRIIALVGLSLTIFFGFFPLSGVALPSWVIQVGIASGIGLLIFSAGFYFGNGGQTEDLVESANLKLHIFGDDRTPSRISFSNIYRWYVLRTELITINQSGAGERRTANVTLFITFEKPVRLNTLEVASPDMRLPPFEVKDFNIRSAVIAFSGALPQGTLEISVH